MHCLYSSLQYPFSLQEASSFCNFPASPTLGKREELVQTRNIVFQQQYYGTARATEQIAATKILLMRLSCSAPRA